MTQINITTPKGSVIRAEVAQTPAERRLGLAGRLSLPAGTGMLFVFDFPGFHRITMQGMNFPLDLLWLTGDKTISWAVWNAWQRDFQPHAVPASYVLELGAGECRRLGLEVGDVLRF